jgi:predicted kinase
MELVIFVGLQASGKSTFFQRTFAMTHNYVSKDQMRNNKNRDRRQLQLLHQALSAEHSVVVDNTNPTPADRAVLIQTGQQYGATIVGYYFESNLQECLVRNHQRVGKARVSDVGIFATIKKLVRPSYEEGFDRLLDVRILTDGQFAVHPVEPEQAIDGWGMG